MGNAIVLKSGSGKFRAISIDKRRSLQQFKLTRSRLHFQVRYGLPSLTVIVECKVCSEVIRSAAVRDDQ
jgi:hypothetical protein